MLPVVGTWMWCPYWNSLYCVTSMQISLGWRCPGSMWAWSFQPFAGILRITGVIPLTTSTGEWGPGKPERQSWWTTSVTLDVTYLICPLCTCAGVSRRPGMEYPHLLQNTWKKWWRNWPLNSLIASLTSCTNLSHSWIPIPSCPMVCRWVPRKQGWGDDGCLLKFTLIFFLLCYFNWVMGLTTLRLKITAVIYIKQ